MKPKPARRPQVFEIQVQDDHLERISQVRKPLYAVAELVWNAVDADADRVDVTLIDDQLGGIKAIEVADNGHGIPYTEAETLFSRLGGSWKQGGRVSREQRRILHGKEGRGRFRAFALGRVVDWNVRYAAAEGVRQYTVSMIKDRLKRVQVDVERSTSASRGVNVTVSELPRDFRSLRDSGAPDELAQIFALYLRQYPNVRIVYAGTFVDPRAVEEAVKEYPLPDIVSREGDTFTASIEIVEWKMRTQRRLYFCNGGGFPLDETSPGIQAPGFDFTAYLKSDYFAKLMAGNLLEIATMDEAVSKALEAAKVVMRDHFRQRAAEKSAGLVEEWQQQDIYPYHEEPVGPVETAERQVFNVVALNVNQYLPSFQDADEMTKRLQLRLLRHAVEHAPADLSKILTEVLELPTEKRQELAELLDRTTLAAIISASKIIADRLEFLQGLETLVFDSEFKHAVRERTQLHRIVAENAWMFGELRRRRVPDGGAEKACRHAGQRNRDRQASPASGRPTWHRGPYVLAQHTARRL